MIVLIFHGVEAGQRLALSEVCKMVDNFHAGGQDDFGRYEGAEGLRPIVSIRYGFDSIPKPGT
jgi:hypothetical protein